MGNLNPDGTDKALPGIRLRKNGVAVVAIPELGFQEGHRSQINFEEGEGIVLTISDQHIDGPEREFKVSIGSLGLVSPHAGTHVDGQSDAITNPLDPRAYPLLAGTLASRPLPDVAGRFYWTTDEHILYRDDGVAWVKVAVADYLDLDGIPGSFTPASHVLATTAALGPEHTISGAAAGQVLRASGATTANFGAIQAADLPIHPPSSHVLATNVALGAEHTISGAAAGQVLRASGATAANFQALASADLPASIDSNARINVLADDTQVALRRGIDFTTHVLDPLAARMTITDEGAFANQVRIEIHAQWEYLGGKQLGSAAVTTGVLTIPARDLILIQFAITAYSAADIAALRFNGDAGNNYWSRYLTAAAGVATLTNNVNVSVPLARLHGTTATQAISGSVAIQNRVVNSKSGHVSVQRATVAAGTSGLLEFGGFEWVNTSAQITSVEMRTAGGVNTLSAGSGFAVFGKDIP